MRTDGNNCGGSRVLDPAESGSFGRIRFFQWVGSGSQSYNTMSLHGTYIFDGNSEHVAQREYKGILLKKWQIFSI